MKAYFDNAATTPLAPEVTEAMLPYLSNVFGNPSSLHAAGREAKAAVENARKSISALLHCDPAEIIFTSGGTEGNNAVLKGSSRKRIITSPIEHHAVLEVVDHLESEVVLLEVDQHGRLDLDGAVNQLDEETLVSLMYVNNEIGTILDIASVSALCQEHGAFFHTDAVQAVGHLPLELDELHIDALTASAHKFHGPKGIGFLYLRNKSESEPLLQGGPQEREWRAGTENVAGIVGMATALELLYNSMEEDEKYVTKLKTRLASGINEVFPAATFNGSDTVYTILNVELPLNDTSEMLLFQLDLQGVMASGGSACSAGAVEESHVLKAIGKEGTASIRFSLSKFNTAEEVDHVVNVLKEIG